MSRARVFCAILISSLTAMVKVAAETGSHFSKIAFYHILLKSIVNRSEEVVNLILEKELEAK